MAGTINNQADPKEVENARAMWSGFTKLVKYSSIATAAVLLLMLVFLY